MYISDYEQALHLWQSLPGMGLSSADEKENIRDFLQKNPSTCFVTLKNGKIIGTILGGSDGRRGYIYHLAVQQSEQYKGKSGIQKCHIFVISDNAEGIAFWEKVGWQLRDDILVMSIEIKD
jgi:ribosomal protein S18 acetylase RimI-like enzyme